MPQKDNLYPIKNITAYKVAKEFSTSPLDYQITMILQGTLQIKTETSGHEYGIRDVLVMVPGKTYQIIPSPENLVLFLTLDRTFVNEHLGSNIQIMCDSREYPAKDYSVIQNQLSYIIASWRDNTANKFAILSQTYQLLHDIQKGFLANTVNLTGSHNNARHHSRIQEIVQYIDENYATAITLSSLAETLYLSPQYLSKFIKQHFNKTFFDYLNQVRIQHALNDICYTDTSITKVAFNNGFPNLTAFNKVFKEYYADTPSNYRKSFQNSRHLKQPHSALSSSDSLALVDTKDAAAYMDTLSEITPYSSAETLTDTHHYVVHADAKHTKSLMNPFIEMINAGFAINMMSSDFQEQLKRTLERIHFKYIRFIGILDNEILPDLHENMDYNFSNVNVILDFLYQQNIIPMIELSSKPRKTTVVATTSGFLVDIPVSNAFPEHHYNKLEALLRHCINRYGLSYVRRWKFEVWAMHSDFLQYLETPQQYALRFGKIRQILSKHIPEPCIGGPGFNTSASANILGEYIQELNVQKLPLSFVSLYLYPYLDRTENTVSQNIGLEDYVLISPDKDILPKRMDDFTESLKHYFNKMPPVYITEYNSDLAGKNHINDSCFQSAFICKAFLNLRTRVDMIGYWLLCDLVEEYAAFASTKDGGIGLLNDNGQCKPSFFSYIFLDHLKNNYLCDGENYIVASSGKDFYEIMVFNYAHISKYYCLNHSDRVNVENTYTVFDSVPTQNIEFQLTNLEPGQYKIKRILLNRDHGSYLDRMARMWMQGNLSFERLNYNLHNLSAEEQRYYADTCVPQQEFFYRESDGTLLIDCQVEAHEVYFYEIRKEL